jgi:fluoroquinolone transport system ATP-binding protein
MWFYREMGSPPVIRVEELRVRYPGAARDAVDGISFEVGAGEVFGFLGPNGAGKSTTQHVLTGQLGGYRGRAEVLGRSVASWRGDLYERIGVGFELPAYFPKLTARENLATFAGLYRGATLAPLAALELVGLAGVADHRPTTFSKGMKMRLNLARALLHQPDVLFLDEPTAGLDPNHAAQVHEVVRARAAAGRTVFLTSHDMDTVDQLCDRVAFLLDGRIRAIDTPRALRLAHGQPRIRVEFRELASGTGEQGRELASGTRQLPRRDGQVRTDEFPLTVPTDPALLALLRDAAVETIHTREATLRDVFIAVTGGRL